MDKIYLILIITFISTQLNSASLNKETGCKRLVNELAQYLQLFEVCSMHNAVPATICQKCINATLNATMKYNELINAEVDNNNTKVKCREIYFDQDRLNIVQSNYDSYYGLWTRASCAECFHTNSSVLTNETKTVFEKITDLKMCISEHITDPCKECASKYQEANDYYNNEILKKHKEVCFDILDSINRTRSLWSKSLKCCKREVSMTAFAAAASVFACLPILFYIGTYFFTKRVEGHHDMILPDSEQQQRSDVLVSTSNYQNGEIISNTEPIPSSSTVNPNNLTKSKEKEIKLNKDIHYDSDHSDDINESHDDNFLRSKIININNRPNIVNDIDFLRLDDPPTNTENVKEVTEHLLDL